MTPSADPEHQFFATDLANVLADAIKTRGGGRVAATLNISDRIEDWRANYRIPDLAVFLPGNPAVIHQAHVRGGPDFAVEILSRGDLALKKLEFYAHVGTRELLLIDRHPWMIELYRLVEGRLAPVGATTTDNPATLASLVLPLTFRLVPGEDRPILEVAAVDGGQSWRI